MVRCFAVLGFVATVDSLEWERLPDAPWSGRSDPCGGVLGSSLVIAGGHANNSYTNDVWRSDDAGRSWQLVLEEAPWAGRSYHSCVVLPGNRLLLVAGHDEYTWYNDVWISGPDMDLATWTAQTLEAPWAKRAAGSLQYQATSGKVFYMAGSDGLLPPAAQNATLFNDVWASSDDGANWELVTAKAAWKAREGFTGQSSGNDIVIAGESLGVFGGEEGYFPDFYFADIWTSEDGANWVKQREQADWAGEGGGDPLWQKKGRSGHIMASQAMPDGSQTLWLSGGFLKQQDVWCLGNVRSPKDLSRTWTLVANESAWPGRFDHMMVVLGDELILYGGEDSAGGIGGNYFNDVWSSKLEPCPTAERFV